jgi:PAS domain S-box-containing protein
MVAWTRAGTRRRLAPPQPVRRMAASLPAISDRVVPPSTDEIAAAPDSATGHGPKAAFVALVVDVLRRRSLTQTQAARRCRTDPPTLAKVLRGRLDLVSLDQLLSWLAALGCGVEIRVAPDPGDDAGITVRRASARAAGDGERTEAARQESEARYRTLLETSPDAVHVHRDGIIILANQEAATLFGAASPAEMVGRAALALVDPASLPLARARTARLTAPGQRNPPTELTLRRLDGRAVVVEAASAAVLLDGQLAVQAVLRDVTERRRLEAELRCREEQCRLALEAAGLGVWDVDETTGAVVLDARCRAMHGLGPEEAVAGEALWARLHPDDVPRVRAAVARAKDPASDGACEVEYRAVLPDGSERWHLAKAQVRFAGAGAARRPVRFVGVVMDVSERWRAEAALRESEARYRATQEHAGVGIGEVDAQGRFLRVNAALCAITGYAEDELLARSVFAITHPDDAWAERAEYARLVAGAIATYAREKRYRRQDGVERWVEVAATAVRDPAGRFLHGVRVVQDVTERKLAEARQRLLLGELNHRVKNTLAVVQALARQTAAPAGASGDLARTFLGRLRALAAAHELLTEARWAGTRLATLVRRVLAPHAGPERVLVAVGEELLPAALTQDLALVLHELATNALMHGALSRPGGRVRVEGGVADGADGGVLRLVWGETGGGPVEPPGRPGFGTALITQALAHTHGGAVELDWRRAGLICRIRVPLGPATEVRTT